RSAVPSRSRQRLSFQCRRPTARIDVAASITSTRLSTTSACTPVRPPSAAPARSRAVSPAATGGPLRRAVGLVEAQLLEAVAERAEGDAGPVRGVLLAAPGAPRRLEQQAAPVLGDQVVEIDAAAARQRRAAALRPPLEQRRGQRVDLDPLAARERDGAFDHVL